MNSEKLGRIFDIIKSEICNSCIDAPTAYDYLVNRTGFVSTEEAIDLVNYLQCLNFHGIREVAHYRKVF
jgi:hypothetical protein